MARLTSKNFYELSKDERKNYLEEFYKLPFVSKIVMCKDFSLITGIILFILAEVVSNFVNFEMVFPYFNSVAEFTSVCTLLFFVILEVYLWISFVRWMKIKHKIEY